MSPAALWQVIRHREALANTVEGYIAAKIGVTQGHHHQLKFIVKQDNCFRLSVVS